MLESSGGASGVKVGVSLEVVEVVSVVEGRREVDVVLELEVREVVVVEVTAQRPAVMLNTPINRK